MKITLSFKTGNTNNFNIAPNIITYWSAVKRREELHSSQLLTEKD
jgi:hypothetical protein